MSVSVCNEIYCDETTNTRTTIISFGTNILFDNKNQAAKRRQQILPFWLSAAILNFLG
jgi:hypothetical protein